MPRFEYFLLSSIPYRLMPIWVEWKMLVNLSILIILSLLKRLMANVLSFSWCDSLNWKVVYKYHWIIGVEAVTSDNTGL